MENIAEAKRIKKGFFDDVVFNAILLRYQEEVLTQRGTIKFRFLSHMFWRTLRNEYDEGTVAVIRKRVRLALQSHRSNHRRRLGINRETKRVYAKFDGDRMKDPLSGTEERKTLLHNPDFIKKIPMAIVATNFVVDEGADLHDDAQALMNVNEQLVEIFFENGICDVEHAKFGNQEYADHFGVFVGPTVEMSGCNAKKGYNGCMPFDSHRMQHHPALQTEIVCICTKMIVDAFERHPFFQRMLAWVGRPENEYFQEFLLPGTPCSHIWWSCEYRNNHDHFDIYNYGPSFIFVPDGRGGGSLAWYHPDEPHIVAKHNIKVGEVLCGRLVNIMHHMEPLTDLPGEEKIIRNSFVMFLHKGLVNAGGPLFHNTVRNHAIAAGTTSNENDSVNRSSSSSSSSGSNQNIYKSTGTNDVEMEDNSNTNVDDTNVDDTVEDHFINNLTSQSNCCRNGNVDRNNSCLQQTLDQNAIILKKQRDAEINRRDTEFTVVKRERDEPIILNDDRDTILRQLHDVEVMLDLTKTKLKRANRELTEYKSVAVNNNDTEGENTTHASRLEETERRLDETERRLQKTELYCRKRNQNCVT